MTRTGQPGRLIMPVGPSLIYLVCSGACACQHGVRMQSWSSHSSRQREDLGNRGQEEWEGGHQGDHLYFIDFSISVDVRGWEAGSRPSLLVLGLCNAVTHPYLFSPPPPLYTTGVWFRFTSGRFNSWWTPLGIPRGRLIWYNFLDAITACTLNVRTWKINRNPTGCHIQVRHLHLSRFSWRPDGEEGLS